ncbi:cytidine deaminase [Haematobacter massiliensis]|uniref:Cytidine deaminase n=1 Tax=Haematobacter massiliensis TaxID=195105 RepID=A0A086YAL9_9RHOB|nr:cytidine deaminase [Haematobacter massiliensis]KFI31319.1 cytidine deaminase [Haematobacter massiliensis]OWJ73630.1 cytidine deaminase [Haematobacter massiliensis]OWJ87054.1 cytidine deaminase [Haematobacter massiliensis]QBJ23389.1 cytidine deaminase [Haematobacter massiliensis]
MIAAKSHQTRKAEPFHKRGHGKEAGVSKSDGSKAEGAKAASTGAEDAEVVAAQGRGDPDGPAGKASKSRSKGAEAAATAEAGEAPPLGHGDPDEALKDAARRVRENAYVPYSGFKVGAAIRSASGAIHMGCNVENAAYPEGTCAEAGAIAAMVAAGDLRIAEVAVIADSPHPVPPCGGCRQKLAEFGDPEVLVVMYNTQGEMLRTTIRDLLPGGFSVDYMLRS